MAKKPVAPLKTVKPLPTKGNIIDRQMEAAKKKKTPMPAKKYNKGGMIKGKC